MSMNPSTDIITFSEQLQSRVKQRLDDFNKDQDELIDIGKLLSFIRGIIDELKSFTLTYKFSSEDEEIRFFKEVKPILLSQYFYYKKIFAIKLFDSFKDTKTRQANYYKILKQLEKFVQKNLEFYEYCMTNTVFRDKHYFTRNVRNVRSIDRDEKFSTGYDTKLAKILANELTKKYIFKLLNHTDSMHPGLNWTGSKTDLIELVYALYSTEVINNGSADIKLIADSFKHFFNIDIGDYYRVFMNIRLRKSGQTNFLDELKNKLRDKLNEFN